MNSPLKLFEYDGMVFCDGLFRMHDELGFSLTDSLIECALRRWRPCIQQFRADAIRAGWSGEKAQTVIDSAIADASTSISVPSERDRPAREDSA